MVLWFPLFVPILSYPFFFFFFLSPLLSLVRGLSLAFIRPDNAWFCKAWGPR